MNFGKIQLNWFDLLVMGLVVFGIWQGRKRGMSEELLDVFQWLCIVVVGAMLYMPVGRVLARTAGMPLLYGYVVAYALIAILIKLGITSTKRAVGEKLVHSDAFGRFEYYLGMMAGTLRCFCVLIFVLAFLHAKQITDAERAATAKMQADNFGSISFPTIGSLQHAIFYESLSGKFIRKNLHAQLIQPSPVQMRVRNQIGRQRERAVEEVLQ